VDSTYLLPLLGVKVVDLPENPLGSLISKNFHVEINEISIFEGVGKALKEAGRAMGGEEAVRRLETGVRSILFDTRVEKFPVCELETINCALKLYRHGLEDLPDCLIAASAVRHTGLLLTESGDIGRVVQDAWVELEIVSWKDLL
jgi:predicted nucleic acid-binding protein